VCRPCDHGRLYCGEECAAFQRRISVQLAREKYARSTAGKKVHANAEARRRRERKAKIVMDHSLATTEPEPILGGRAVEVSVVLVAELGDEDDHEFIHCRRREADPIGAV